jgi:hypothetical protein
MPNSAPSRIELPSPAVAVDVVADSRRRRPLYFDGKFLTAADLNREQAYLMQREADLARSLGFGVIDGLRVTRSELTTSGSANAAAAVRIAAGFGLTPAGEIVRLGRSKVVDLADVPRIAQLNASFGLSRVAQDPSRNLNGLFVLGLRAVEFTANPVPIFPAATTGETSLHDGETIEATAVTLVPYPSTALAEDPARARARVARELFIAQKPPELPSGVLPLAMLCLRGGLLQWVDEFLVRREAGDDDRFGFGFAPRALAEAHFYQYQDLLRDVDAANAGRFAASAFFEALPPGGPLPENMIDTSDFTQAYFPPEARVDLALVPQDELPALMEDSIDLPPIDLQLPPEDNDALAILVLVPVPRADYAEAVATLGPRMRSLRAATMAPFARQNPLDFLRQWKPALAPTTEESATGTLEDAAWITHLGKARKLWYVRRRHLPDGSALASLAIDAGSEAPPVGGPGGSLPPGPAPGPTPPPTPGPTIILPPAEAEDDRMLAALNKEELWGRYALLKSITSPGAHSAMASAFTHDLILSEPLLRHALISELEEHAQLESDSPEENFKIVVSGPRVRELTREHIERAAKRVLRPELIRGLRLAFERQRPAIEGDLKVRTVLGQSRRLPELAEMALTPTASDAKFVKLVDQIVKIAPRGERQRIRESVDKLQGRG